MKDNRIRYGMVGGGPGALIGNAHRIGMRIDDQYILCAGAFSRDHEKSRQTGQEYRIDDNRIYADFRRMAADEAARPDGIRMVSVVTSNESHFDICRAFLEKGIHVVCDKPLTVRVEESEKLLKLARSKNLILGLTHNYTGYEMVREAASLVRAGELGSIRTIMAEHATGWAGEALENTGHRQASWRADPALSGRASVLADLGTHAYHLLRFVSGLEVTEIAADLCTNVPGRKVFDDARAMLKLSNGGRGSLWASMTATGNEHGLNIRIYGDKASLHWKHEDPQHLTIRQKDGSTLIKHHGQPGLSHIASRRLRVSAGHPEGFLESFANIYFDVADAIRKIESGGSFVPGAISFPDARDGVMGLRFIDSALRSHDEGGAWVGIPSHFD